MKISVIITTYNHPKALSLILEALAEQTDAQFEVVIADDGSGETTQSMLASISLPFTWQHIWQKDDGFQASKIRNKAVAAAQGEYLIFIDGDCVPRRDFIQRHRDLAQLGWLVAGNRVLLSEMLSQKVLAEKIPIYRWSRWQWLAARVRNECNRWVSLLNLPQRSFMLISAKQWQGVKTCNLALFKTDFLAVNGFDEAYVGWGFEDSDLIIRLIRSQIRVKRARFGIAVLHLYHTPASRENVPENLARLETARLQTSYRIQQGVSQYLPTAKS